MTVKELLTKIENGSVHVLIYSMENGEIFLKSIWQNIIPNYIMESEIEKIEVLDYEIRLGVKL